MPTFAPEASTIVFLLLCGIVESNLSSKYPSLTGEIYAPILRLNGGIRQFEPITARVVVETDTTTSQNDISKRPLYAGAIVMARGFPWRTVYPWMHNVAVPGGAVAVLLNEAKVDEATGWAEFLTAPYSTNFPIPVLALSQPTFRRIEEIISNLTLQERETFELTVTDRGGLTPWRQVMTSAIWWIVSIFTAASSCAMAVFSLIRFYDFYRALGVLKWGVPQTVLLLQFIPSIIRFMYWSIDPMFQRSVLPQVLHTPWRTWPFSITISSMLVLVFYWFESVSQTSLQFSWKVEHYKWPCYTLIAVSYILAIAGSLLYWTSVDAYWAWLIDYVEPGYYLLVGLGLGLFYVITAAKILMAMHQIQKRGQSSSSNTESKEERKTRKASSRIRNTSFKLVAMGMSYVSVVLIGFYTLNKSFIDWIPNHFVYTWAMLHIMLNVNSFCTIIVLVPPRAKSPNGTMTASRSADLDSNSKKHMSSQPV